MFRPRTYLCIVKPALVELRRGNGDFEGLRRGDRVPQVIAKPISLIFIVYVDKTENGTCSQGRCIRTERC